MLGRIIWLHSLNTSIPFGGFSFRRLSLNFHILSSVISVDIVVDGNKYNESKDSKSTSTDPSLSNKYCKPYIT